jgi:hypothetical protein
VIIPSPLVLFAPIDESATTRDALGFLEILRGGPNGRQHEKRAVDPLERPLDGGRLVPIAVDQFDALVRPACRLCAVADQRTYLLALRQQMLCRCAADFSGNSHY